MSAPRTIAYGEAPEQVADLWLPEGSEDASHPVAVLLHGGFWRTPYDRSLMDDMAADLTRRGWAAWNVEYRRGAGAAERTFSDVRAAFAALRELSDPLRHADTVVIGHSAGGHLALWGGPAGAARLVISLAGVADLHAAAAAGLGSGAAVEFMGSEPSADPAAWQSADPLLRLPTGVRTLLVHGDRDDRVPVAQSRDYLAAAERAGDPCELLELPGEDHFGVIDPASSAYGAWVRWLA